MHRRSTRGSAPPPSAAPAIGIRLAIRLAVSLAVAASLPGCRQAAAAPHAPATAKPQSAPAKTGPTAKPITWSFEDVSVGALPAGWKVEETNPRGPRADWRVTKAPHAPSGERVLTLANAQGHTGSTFNLCWTAQPSLQDGELAVQFRANAGREDQGGGIAWRIQDKDNYYVARFNPLEDNFRLYSVKAGHRRMLATATVKLAPNAWHTMKIVQRGAHYEASLDGKRWLEGHSDLFPMAGGVGLWTKADAATSFDDLSVRPAARPSEGQVRTK